MAKSKESWNKKEMENLRKKKKEQKAKRKQEKKDQAKDGKRSFEDMIAYVDENGQLTNIAPGGDPPKKRIDASAIEISTPRRTDEELVELTYTGKISFFDQAKGYGFIKGANQQSYFVHANDLLQPVRESDWVMFSAEKGARGMKAVNVKKV